MRILHDVGFVHLHVHSSYSLLEGALKIGALADLAKADRQPALALTDTNNLFGALEFSEKLAGKGIQPIPGMQLSVCFEDAEPNGRGGQVRSADIVLLAQSEAGYRNLTRLASRAYFDVGLGEAPRVAASLLREHADGVIALTGGFSGPLDTALRVGGRVELASQRLDLLQAAYGDRLYVEIQRHGLDAERGVEGGLVALADERGIPLVATNEPFFARRDDYEAHDALLAIAEGRLVSDDKRRRLSPEHRFKTRSEMAELFADMPDALAATVEVAMRCAYRVTTRKPILPNFRVQEQGQELDEAAELTRQAEDGLEARLLAHGTAPGLDPAAYRERLAFELSVIGRMKYAGYFLIVADFIKWAKDHDIPVGPGRGSGAGSLVAYALTVTDLDPLRFGLLFERFLNPERVSMPDFDIDFCVEGRERVIAYVQERYGDSQVAQIITFGTLLARGVMRDVGRVLEMPYGQVDKLTKLVPNNPANPVTLDQAIKGEPKLQIAAVEEPVVGRMLGIARKLEGLHRHASTHAAGVVIGDRPLEELVPLYRDPKTGMRVTQYNMKWVEQAGLVKFDFLGLKTLTVLKQIGGADPGQRGGSRPRVPARSTMRALTRRWAAARRSACSRWNPRGMRKALCEMEADRFEDLIALVALYRPGPMANIPVYCARKLGRDPEPEDRWYPHPSPEADPAGDVRHHRLPGAGHAGGPAAGRLFARRRRSAPPRHGQEDQERDGRPARAVRVRRGRARAARRRCRHDLRPPGQVRRLRLQQEPRGCVRADLVPDGLPKGELPGRVPGGLHGADLDNTTSSANSVAKAQRLGIAVEPPSINASEVEFRVERRPDAPGAIRYALAAVKGVGRAAVEALVEARRERPFGSLTDLAQRINPRFLNKRTLESLVAAGAFDELEPDRAKANAMLESVLGLAQRSHEMRSEGAIDMFGGVTAPDIALRVPLYQPWTAAERLRKEYEAVGFFLSGHPLDEYGDLLRKLRVQTWAEFCRQARAQGGTVGRVAASVLDRSERRTKSGNKMGIVNLSDQTGHYEAIVFAEGLQTYRDLLEPGRPVLLVLQAGLEGDEVRARIQSVEALDQALAKHKNDMRIFLRDAKPISIVQERLRARRPDARGEGEVSLILILENGEREVEVRLPGRYPASPQIAGAIRTVPGVVDVQMS
jgi:DNA polymerase-3 subunit alpha